MLSRLAIALLLVLPCAGQEDIHLELKTHDGRSTYRIGEVVPIDLWFSSTVEGKYTIFSATSDRSGRGNHEEFIVEPKSWWQDPLDLYFRAASFIGGGLSGIPSLSPRPIAVGLDLNEWVRFDVPGDYTVGVRSRRVHSVPPIIVASNPLSLTIVPATTEWQRVTLRKAVDTLTTLHCWNLTQPPASECGLAMRILRFLGTDDAAREMALHAGNPYYSMGLAGSPARQAGLIEMEKLLRDPDFPVDDRFLLTLSILALPPGPGPRHAERYEIEQTYRRELAARHK